MATIRMKKGERYADVFDSPESIKQAQLDGYVIVEQPKKVESTVEKTEPVAPKKGKKPTK